MPQCISTYEDTADTFLQADNQDINTKLKEQLAKERAKAAFKAAREAKGKKRPAEDAEDAEDAAPESSKEGTAEVEAEAESSDEDGEVEEPEKKSKGRGREPKSDKAHKTKKGGARNKRQKKDQK